MPVTESHPKTTAVVLPPSENKLFYPALDGLRAIAVLMVFFHHYVSSEILGSTFHPVLLSWGWTGVDIFFVLSGFLITGILYDTRNNVRRFRTFYMRRTFRIFPLYYGIFAALLLTWPIFHWAWHPALALWPLYLGNYGRFLWIHKFLADPSEFVAISAAAMNHHALSLKLDHLWSLCVEEQFYLVWPFLVFWIKDNLRLQRLCVAVFFICLAARGLCQWFISPEYLQADLLYRFAPLRVDSFLVGGFVALLLRSHGLRYIRRFAGPIIAVFLLTFGTTQTFFYFSLHRFYDEGSPWVRTIGFSFIDVFAAALILLAIDPGTRFARILQTRWLCRLGQMSYGFYVLHFLLMKVYLKIALTVWPSHVSVIIIPIALVLTVTLSYLSFHLYEVRFLRLKERFTVG